MSETGEQLVQKAQDTLNRFIYLGNRNQDALGLYEKAVIAFKKNKKFLEAGQTHLKMIDCLAKLNREHEFAATYSNAAKCFLTSKSTNEYVDVMKKAIQLNLENGKFLQAAAMEKEVGDTCEKDERYDFAADFFYRAYDHYEGENQKPTAYNCLLRAAHAYALAEKYIDAVKAFETCTENALKDRSTKADTKEYLMKAMLCRIANKEDSVALRDSYEEYEAMSQYFDKTSYQNIFIDKSLQALSQSNVQDFRSAMREYDGIKKLDKWMEKILIRIFDNASKGDEDLFDLT